MGRRDGDAPMGVHIGGEGRLGLVSPCPRHRFSSHPTLTPTRMLSAYGGEAALRGALFNSLKEAAAVARGSAQRVMEMAAGAQVGRAGAGGWIVRPPLLDGPDGQAALSLPTALCSPTPPTPTPTHPQEDLFRQALASCLPRYRAILASLQLAPAAQRGGPPRIPLRLYLRTAAPGGYLASYEGIAATSRPVAALGAGGEPVSLRQALLPLLQEVLRRSGGNGGGAGSEGVQSQPGTPAAAAGGVQSQPGTPAAAAAAEAPKAADHDGGMSPSPSADVELAAAPSAEAPGSAAAAAAPGDDEGGSSAAAAADEPAAPSAAAAAAAAEAGDGGIAAADGSSSQAAALLDEAAAAGRVLVGGTAPPLDAPLAWLHANLHAPDYFLYVVAHVPLPH